MILAVAATDFEMGPFRRLLDWQKIGCETYVTGVGSLEAGIRLTRYFCENPGTVDAVVNFGVGGAYLGTTKECTLLDICLAEREILGDFGICFSDKMEPLAKDISGPITFELDAQLLDRAVKILSEKSVAFAQGVFVTVNGVSATRQRGEMLQKVHNGLCENMEGAAIARVCADFSLPLLEMRCISNFVEDRDLSRWKLAEACQKSAEIAAECIKEMIVNP